MGRLFNRAVRVRPPTTQVTYKDSVRMSVSKGFTWPRGAEGAVSLTYDDGLSNHLDLVAPQLESMGLRGTFYPHITSVDFLSREDEWGELVKRGHELGNHMIFHPCMNNPAIDPAFNLAEYDETRWRKEAELANWILSRLDGHAERTFGNTCWDNWIGSGENRTCIERLASSYFTAARGEMSNRAVNIHDFNLFNLGTYPGDGYSFDELRKLIMKATSNREWLILTFHCVGKKYHLYIDEPEHRRLIKWLSDETARIWTSPLREVSKHLLIYSEKCPENNNS